MCAADYPNSQQTESLTYLSNRQLWHLLQVLDSYPGGGRVTQELDPADIGRMKHQSQ